MGQHFSLGVIAFSFSDEVPPSSRRQDEVHSSTLRVGTLETIWGKQLCLIRNISRGGLRARVYRRYKTGTRATVQLKTEQRVNGVVVWAEADHIGIKFDQPIDVESVLSTETLEASGLRARLPRIECSRSMTMRIGANLYRCKIVDISQGGIKAEVNESIPMGPAVVSIPGLVQPMPSSVRWCERGYVGIEFNELIPFRRLLNWTRATEKAVQVVGPARSTPPTALRATG